MSRLTVKFFTKNEGRNAGLILVYGEWPARILKHRGWKSVIYERAMTQDEFDYVRSCLRYVAIRYETVDDLLADEIEVLSNEQFAAEELVLRRFINN